MRELGLKQGSFLLGLQRLVVVVSLCFLAGCESWTSCERFPGRCPGDIFQTVSAKTSGISGPVAWRLTETRAGGDASLTWYSFVLVLTETTGSQIIFTSIRRQVWGEGARIAQDSGSWRLQANGERRLPMAVRRTCQAATCSFAYPPYWNIRLTGKDEADHEIRVEIQVAVPVAVRAHGGLLGFDGCPTGLDRTTPFGVELLCLPKND